MAARLAYSTRIATELRIRKYNYLQSAEYSLNAKSRIWVLTYPGEIVLTRIVYGAHSTAKLLDNMATPPLDAL